MQIRDVIETILSEIPDHNRNETVDTLKTGHMNTPVTAVAVTFMATLPVIRRTVELGANFLITHEPTFYSHMDDTTPIAKDPIYRHKRDFIDRHNIAIWRCHDSWHRLKGDGIITGMTRQLGWESQRQEGQRAVYVREKPVALSALIDELKKRLGIGGVRVIGEPNHQCRRIGFAVGCPSSATHRTYFNQDQVDTLICGETREWETPEYVRDAIATGRSLALAVVGHANSEEFGMQYLADWLRERLSAIPIHFLPAGDPFRQA